MGGWYQSVLGSGRSLRRYLPTVVWLLLSPLLMWSPSAGPRRSMWLEAAGNGFHAIWFALGAMLAAGALRRLRPLSIWLVLTLLGVVFEIGQTRVPGRGASLSDGLLNAAGAALGLWWVRRSARR